MCRFQSYFYCRFILECGAITVKRLWSLMKGHYTQFIWIRDFNQCTKCRHHFCVSTSLCMIPMFASFISRWSCDLYGSSAPLEVSVGQDTHLRGFHIVSQFPLHGSSRATLLENGTDKCTMLCLNWVRNSQAYILRIWEQFKVLVIRRVHR